MDDLKKKRCVPCESGSVPMSRQEFAKYLDQVKDWTVIDEDTKLMREFTFKDFKTALDFVNLAGEIAEDEGHHPNIYLHSWNKVKVTVYTHSIKGLSENDFILAAKINAIECG
jgi:4a-hydroxytetrahydrobiopterin dehydratase